jgi:hypothetical protein
MDDSTAALIAGAAGFVGAALGGVLSGVYQHVRDWCARPILEIDFAGKQGVSVVETEIIREPTNISEVYVRVRVRNRGYGPAQNCRVYMTALHEVKGNQLLETSFSDAKPIAWAGSDFQPRVVPNGVDFYVDVVRVNKDAPAWVFSVQLFVSQKQTDTVSRNLSIPSARYCGQRSASEVLPGRGISWGLAQPSTMARTRFVNNSPSRKLLSITCPHIFAQREV